jgi:hypothetical protein
MKDEKMKTATKVRDLPVLQQRLMEAIPALTQNDFSYYATDLYVRSLPVVEKWLKENYEFSRQIEPFKMGIDQDKWLDIPFAGYWKTLEGQNI